ncbi:MAG TPA: bacillithiol biosynthesis BshC [Gemmatimonadaceae bacterium]
MSVPRVLTEPLGGTPLSLAIQRGELANGRPWPESVDAWRDRVRATRQRFDGGAWLDVLGPAFGSSARLPGLVRAAQTGVVVTTGQQAGLFGGPMLTLVKAISARALADSLERALGVPCAAVFWAATDDADFAEAASVMIPGTGGARRLSLHNAPPPGTPMSATRMTGLSELLSAMERCSGSDGDQLMALLRRSYRDGATVGDAYVELLRGILEPLNIAVLDASHPALRRASRPLLSVALQRASQIERALDENDRGLSARGFSPQVDSIAGLSLVFAYESGIKRRIPTTEATTVAAATDLGANVLLRPIIEASLIPTVAYAAGPGELAYFAQVPPIASALGVPEPIAVPRWSTMLIEAAIDRILDRFSIAPSELRDIDSLMTRLVRGRMPAVVQGPLEDLRATAASATTALRQGGVDDTIVDGLRAQLELRIARGERRIIAALKRREADLTRDLGTARGALYPDGIRQERVLSFIPYLARYGMPLIEQMLMKAGDHATNLIGASRAESVAVR